jgi:hypothetical protein
MSKNDGLRRRAGRASATCTGRRGGGGDSGVSRSGVLRSGVNDTFGLRFGRGRGGGLSAVGSSHVPENGDDGAEDKDAACT